MGKIGNLISIRSLRDERGSLAVVESSRDVPFEIKRLFYLFDVPFGQQRGAHAHKTLHQVIICVSGTIMIRLDNGRKKLSMLLDNPTTALHIPPMTWATQEQFSPGAVGIVLASDLYDESDYIRNYNEFKRAIEK